MTQTNDVQLVTNENVVKETVVKETVTPVVTEPPKPGEEPQSGKTRFPSRINDVYRLIRSAVEVSLIDPAIIDMAARYGFKTEKINAGKIALDNYEQASEHYRDCETVNVAKSNAFAELFAQIDNMIEALIVKARIAFKNSPEIYKSLGVAPTKSRSFAQWDVRAAMFIEKLCANPRYLEELKDFDTTQETLDTLKRQREELAVLFNAKKIAVSEMRLASKQKQENFKKLRDWYMEYRKAMRFAFKEDPAQLIKIGIALKPQRSGTVIKPQGNGTANKSQGTGKAKKSRR